MSSKQSSNDFSEDEPQNLYNSFGSHQDEDEWLRQHGASGFSGFSASDSRRESESSQPSSKTGVKLAEPSERTTSGKYSYTRDDLIDPDD